MFQKGKYAGARETSGLSPSLGMRGFDDGSSIAKIKWLRLFILLGSNFSVWLLRSRLGVGVFGVLLFSLVGNAS